MLFETQIISINHVTVGLEKEGHWARGFRVE